jgi:replicative DNA helicase
LRVPPHSIDAEQAVLGGLMLAPDALDKVADKLAELISIARITG